MKSIRLLPVVIFAALALLIFKGIGLVTEGGYILNGPVLAAEGEAATPEAMDTSAAMPVEASMADTSPTLGDTSPTIATSAEPPPAPSGHEDAAAAPPEGEAHGSEPASLSASEQAAPQVANTACPSSPPAASSSEASDEALTDKIGNAMTTNCPPTYSSVDANGDAVPTTVDGNGHVVPLAGPDAGSQAALVERLGERRTELDKREADLDMRTTLLDAAERRLDERTKQLASLQAQVDALVDEKQAAEEAGFKSVVSMYETMKPKDAAKVFNELDLDVLLKVARAMNPRKMSPVLAAMDAKKADVLTTALAAVDPPETVADSSAGPAPLPQIVGK